MGKHKRVELHGRTDQILILFIYYTYGRTKKVLFILAVETAVDFGPGVRMNDA